MNKKDEIIQQASILFSERGYYGVGLNELLTMCNVPKGSFYHYFPEGKKQLMSEVLDYTYHSMMDGIVKRFEDRDLETLFTGMVENLAARVAQQKYFASLTMTMCGIESVYLDPLIQQKAASIYQDWQQKYYEFILKYTDDKEDAKIKAQTIFCLVHGSMISSWIKQDNSDLLLIKDALVRIIRDIK